MCEHCNTPETVEHYLTACKRHTRARSKLIHKILHHKNEEVRDKSKDIATLLAHPEVIPLTLDYVTAMRRFPLHTPRKDRAAPAI